MKVVWVLLAGIVAANATAGELPSDRKNIVDLMRKVNSWQMAHPRMGAMNRDWERATWYTGVMAAWKSTGEGEFFDQALAWGKLHGWQVGDERNGANKLFCVETWLELYFAGKDKAMIAPVLAWIDAKSPTSPFGDPKWYEQPMAKAMHTYVDSLYGAPRARHAGQSHRRPAISGSDALVLRQPHGGTAR